MDLNKIELLSSHNVSNLLFSKIVLSKLYRLVLVVCILRQELRSQLTLDFLQPLVTEIGKIRCDRREEHKTAGDRQILHLHVLLALVAPHRVSPAVRALEYLCLSSFVRS